MAQDFDKNRETPFLNTSSGAVQQQVFFARILDQMVDALVFMDSGLNIRYANQPFFDLFGYDEKDIIGQSIRKLGMDDNFANLTPQQIARILKETGTYHGEVLRRAKGHAHQLRTLEHSNRGRVARDFPAGVMLQPSTKYFR